MCVGAYVCVVCVVCALTPSAVSLRIAEATSHGSA